MNKGVELIKSEIYEVKSNLQKFTDLSKKEPENEAHSFYVTYFTNRLTILQQIKSELEAWEIVKRILDLTVKEDKQKYDFIYYWLIYHPYELLVIEKQDYEILIKALEVEECVK